MEIDYRNGMPVNLGNLYREDDDFGSFGFFGRQVKLYPDPNERALELAVAHEFLSLFPPRQVVEVGATTSTTYFYDVNDRRKATPLFVQVPHTVIDIGDQNPWIVKTDAEDYDYVERFVLSISTLEHIGNGDYGEVDRDKAVRCLTKIINQSRAYLISFPPRYNPTLDFYVQRSDIPRFFFRKTGDREWSHREGEMWHYWTDPTNGDVRLVCFLSNVQWSRIDEYSISGPGIAK